MSYSKEAVEEKTRLYRFILFSFFFTPVAASMAFLGPLFFFAVPVAFYYLAFYVLPIAFGGLAIGYFASRRRNLAEIKRLKNAGVGYFTGFVIGLNIVSLYPLAAFQFTVPFRLLILVAAFGGLILSFLYSRIRKVQSNYPYSYWVDIVTSVEYKDRNWFRRNVTLILAGLCVLVVILPNVVPT